MATRREVLSGIGAASAGALVFGWDSQAGQWITEASAHGGGHGVPDLDGELVADRASREAVSTDVGNLVTRVPVAVLRPRSANDVVELVRFCKRFGIPVAARGQGHSTDGQGLTNGLLIDSSTLATIHEIGTGYAVVDGGCTWKQIILEVSSSGQTPPVLTGFTGLSVGGTLSMGGVSANPNRGAQVDRVTELQVVTGQGDLVTCSLSQNRELFEAVLAGVGQYGIIVRARIDLVPLPPLVRLHQLIYVDNATAFADLRTLLARGEVDDSFILWAPNPAGGWIYVLNVTKFYDPSAPPDSDFLTRGLNDITPQRVVADIPFVPYVLRIDAVIDELKAAGLWEGVQHPWFDVWLPDSAVESYVGEVLPTLQPDDVGAVGFLLLFPLRRSLATRPNLRLPGSGEFVWLFDILTSAAGPGRDPAFADRMQTRNRRLFEKARAVGGTRYPIGTVRFSRVDWVRQYGPRYFTLAQLKRRYDPRGILTPGPGIF